MNPPYSKILCLICSYYNFFCVLVTFKRMTTSLGSKNANSGLFGVENNSENDSYSQASIL